MNFHGLGLPLRLPGWFMAPMSMRCLPTEVLSHIACNLGPHDRARAASATRLLNLAPSRAWQPWLQRLRLLPPAAQKNMRLACRALDRGSWAHPAAARALEALILAQEMATQGYEVNVRIALHEASAACAEIGIAMPDTRALRMTALHQAAENAVIMTARCARLGDAEEQARYAKLAVNYRAEAESLRRLAGEAP